MEEDVGGVRALGQVSHLVDEEDVRVRIGRQRLMEASLPASVGEILDELRRGRKEGFEAVLNGPLPDGDRQMGLAAARLAQKDQRPPLGHEVRPEVGAEEGLAEGRLPGEVEFLDGLEEGEAGAAGEALQACLLPSRHFFGQQESEEVAERPAVLLGLAGHLLVDPAHVSQVEALEESLQFRLGEIPALGDVVVGRDVHRFTSL